MTVTATVLGEGMVFLYVIYDSPCNKTCCNDAHNKLIVWFHVFSENWPTAHVERTGKKTMPPRRYIGTALVDVIEEIGDDSTREHPVE